MPKVPQGRKINTLPYSQHVTPYVEASWLTDENASLTVSLLCCIILAAEVPGNPRRTEGIFTSPTWQATANQLSSG